jgi:hypothetical protein
MDVAEGGERALACDELSHELKTLVEAPQDIQHQGAVVDKFAKICEGVSLALHLAAVLVDGERPLSEVAELRIKEQSPRLTVV